MSKEQNESKRTFRIGQTKVTTHISENDPVFKGVMHAAEIEGGQFPEHVGHIVVRPDVIKSAKKDHYKAGNCIQTTRGGSVINIFAGSIKAVVNSYLVDIRATNVTLHEIAHSERSKEIQEGAWLHNQPSGKWEEEDAEAYVTQAHHKFQERQAKKRAGQPRMTWRQLLESKKDQ